VTAARSILLLVAAGALAHPAIASADGSAGAETTRNGWSMGGTLHRFQDDFGIGGLLASPLFLGGRLRVAVAGGVAWYPYATDEAGLQEWSPYGDLRLVIEGGDRAAGSPVRLYGFGGPMLILLPGDLSDQSVSVGGIGGFGFEYYFTSTGADGPVSYFTELGGVGGSARADQLSGEPLLANGFFVTVGLRWTL